MIQKQSSKPQNKGQCDENNTSKQTREDQILMDLQECFYSSIRKVQIILSTFLVSRVLFFITSVSLFIDLSDSRANRIQLYTSSTQLTFNWVVIKIFSFENQPKNLHHDS